MDLIDRQVTIKAIMSEPADAHYPSWYADIVRNLPSAEPELATNLQPSCNQLATDCISRQAAIDAFYTQSDDDGWWTGTVQDAEELLKGLPSAEPEIIRCKDCKHQEKFFHTDGRRKGGGYYIYGCDFAEGYSHVCLDDDFCSRAERRTDG